MILRNVCATQARKFLNKTPLFALQNYNNSDEKSFNNETCFLIELIQQQLKELICDDLWRRSLVAVEFRKQLRIQAEVECKVFQVLWGCSRKQRTSLEIYLLNSLSTRFGAWNIAVLINICFRINQIISLELSTNLNENNFLVLLL